MISSHLTVGFEPVKFWQCVHIKESSGYLPFYANEWSWWNYEAFQ